MGHKGKTKFFTTKNNIIYKACEDKGYFLKLSPWKSGEDRRLFYHDERTKKLQSISFNKATQIINQQFRDYETDWVFNGQHYYVANDNSCITTNQEQIIKDKYSYRYTYINRHGVECSYNNDYYLCWHNGKIYLASILGTYYPRVLLYKITDLNDEPTEFAKWTNIKNCKAIRRF